MESIVYNVFIIILTYFLVSQYVVEDFGDPDRNGYRQPKLAFGAVAFVIFLIGLMPFTGHYTADRANYVGWYGLYRGKPFSFSWDEANYLYDNIFAYIATNNYPPSYFFLPVAIIYVGCIYWACHRFFSKDALLAFVVYLGALSTFSYGINGAKAGAAAALFLVAIAYRENWKMALLFCFLSLGFHHSMAAPIIVFILTYFVKQRNFFIILWLSSCLIAAMGITAFQEFLAGFTNDTGGAYLTITTKDRDVSGFRPDFILYSAVPIYIGYYLHRNYEIESETYSFLLNLYTGLNALFILCSYGSYINRIAYLSWLMYPFVLIYPFLNFDLGDRHFRYLKYAVYGHLGFTIFMDVIYYGLIHG